MLPAGVSVITQARGPAGRPGMTRAEGMSAPGIVHPIRVKSHPASVSADASLAMGNMRTQAPGSTGGARAFPIHMPEGGRARPAEDELAARAANLSLAPIAPESRTSDWDPRDRF